MSARRRSLTDPAMETIIERLIVAATRARENAYAPYSKYRVGAAIATESGIIYPGCNVENASFPAGICAERTAVSSMIAAGDRIPIACAIVTAGPTPAPPCGICRQVLVEFARDMPIVLLGLDGKKTLRRDLELRALMPEVFELPPR
jgi:cytidine deaminase